MDDLKKKYDLAVIGAGPGGYVAALAAAAAGMKVAIIEKRKYFGGTCLNRGCIPTKTLLAASDILHQIALASQFGITIDDPPSLNWSKLQEKKNSIIEKLRRDIRTMFRSRKVDAIHGTATLNSINSLKIDTNSGIYEIHAEFIIIATGSQPILPAIWNDVPGVVSSDELLSSQQIPSEITIIGGGIIGCEFASMLSSFGTATHLVEITDRLIPSMDSEQAEFLTETFVKRGLSLHIGKKVQLLRRQSKRVRVTLDTGENWESKSILIAIGRRPVTSELRLKVCDVKTDDKGHVLVDGDYRSSVSNIFCVGDANGKCLLAHAAMKQAEHVVNILCGKKSARPRSDVIPWCVYTNPELSSAGMTEQMAKKEGRQFTIGRHPFAISTKALTIGQTEGFIKILRDIQDGKILGVHIAGHSATELIHTTLSWIGKKVSDIDAESLLFAHPTYSESLKVALDDTFASAIHLPARKTRILPAAILSRSALFE